MAELPAFPGRSSGGADVGGRAWTAATAYKAGDVVNVAGALYVANADHVSGGAFTPANWTLALPSGAGIPWTAIDLTGAPGTPSEIGAPFDDLAVAAIGALVLFRGGVSFAGAVAGGTTLFTLPAGIPRPAKTKRLTPSTSGGVAALNANNAGQVSAIGSGIAAGQFLLFDDCHFTV